MTVEQLEVNYRRYIACLNERHLDLAEAFYADELLYNGRRITRAAWRRTAIEDTLAAMPDLQWHVEQLVIEGRDVFARLRDTGTLRTPFEGVPPTGTPTSFGEHVLYRFRADYRTDEVWSVIDLAAMRRNGAHVADVG